MIESSFRWLFEKRQQSVDGFSAEKRLVLHHMKRQRKNFLTSIFYRYGTNDERKPTFCFTLLII